MPRRLLLLMMLLAVETGCPHAWGREGTIEMALHRDMKEYYSEPPCKFSKEEWEERCKNLKAKPYSEQERCPQECRLREDPP